MNILVNILFYIALFGTIGFFGILLITGFLDGYDTSDLSDPAIKYTVILMFMTIIGWAGTFAIYYFTGIIPLN